jgi:hypothetical protein
LEGYTAPPYLTIPPYPISEAASLGGLFLWFDFHFHWVAVAIIDLGHVHRPALGQRKALGSARSWTWKISAES